MKTTYRIRQPYADIFLNCARKAPCNSPVRPVSFIRKMKTNRGGVGMLTGFGLDAEGLERKNPVIVALGDSVTAGHFEMIMKTEGVDFDEFMKKKDEQNKHVEALGPEGVDEAFEKGELEIDPPGEIVDARVCYLEQFRGMLIDKYEQTSVSTINAGIAGDHLISMSQRAYRDVIRYQPDLVLINGSLNWGLALGTTQEYKEILRALVRRLKEETTADIVLMTPNGDFPNPMFGDAPEGERTCDRVRTIRELAVEEQVCLADAYAVWEMARDEGCDWQELLANYGNHPSVEGHTVFAITLMKLLEE